MPPNIPEENDVPDTSDTLVQELSEDELLREESTVKVFQLHLSEEDGEEALAEISFDPKDPPSERYVRFELYVEDDDIPGVLEAIRGYYRSRQEHAELLEDLDAED